MSGPDPVLVAQAREQSEADLEHPPDTCWYMSFVDPDRPEGQRWLGACIVRSSSPGSAIGVSWAKGCNPGGQVAMRGPFPLANVKLGYVERLLTTIEEVEEAPLQ